MSYTAPSNFKSIEFFHSFLFNSERKSSSFNNQIIDESCHKTNLNRRDIDCYQVNMVIHQAEKMKMFKPSERLKISSLQTPSEIISTYRRLPSYLKNRYLKYFSGLKFKWTLYNYDIDLDFNDVKIILKDTPSLDQPHVLIDCAQPKNVNNQNSRIAQQQVFTVTGTIQNLAFNRLQIGCLELA